MGSEQKKKKGHASGEESDELHLMGGERAHFLRAPAPSAPGPAQARPGRPHDQQATTFRMARLQWLTLFV